jgi:BolA protein
MPVAEAIEHKLKAGLAPVRLTVTDQSHLHAGHAGARPGGETHFRVEIVSASFRGMTRVARQREVHRLLAAELSGPVHALSIAARTPEEAGDG